MSAVALDTPVRPAAELRPALRAVGEIAADELAEVQPWEAHSELSLVSPEVRLRLLELLPEPEAYGARPASPPTAPPPPALPQEAQRGFRPKDALRYAALRVGQTIRLGLTIVGAIFVLALLAEVFAR